MTRCLIILLAAASISRAAETVIPDPTGLAEISADRRLLAVPASGDAQGIELWDLSARQLRHRVGESDCTALAIAHSGNVIASGDKGGQISVWGVADGNQTTTLNVDGSVRFLALSPDGTRLACRAESTAVAVYDVASGEELVTITPESDLTKLLRGRFTADGSFWAVFGTGIHYWSVGSEPQKLSEVSSPLTAAKLSPDGEVLAVRAESKLLLFTAEGEQDYVDVEGQAEFQFAADGKRLLVLRDDQNAQAADVWSWADGWGNFGIDTSIEGIRDGLLTVADEDGRCAYAESKERRVVVRPTTESQFTLLADDYRTSEQPFPVTAIAFAPQGDRVLVQRDWPLYEGGQQTGTGSVWYLWDPVAELTKVVLPSRQNQESRQVVETVPRVLARYVSPQQFESIEFVGGSNTILARAGRKLHLFEAAAVLRARPARRWKFERPNEVFSATVKEFDFSPDSKWLALDTSRGQLALLSPADGSLKYLMPIDDPYNLGFTRSGKKLTLLQPRAWMQVDMLTLRTSELASNVKQLDQPLDDRYLYPVKFSDDPGAWCLINAKDGTMARQLRPTKLERLGQFALAGDNSRFAVLADRREGRGLGIEVFDLQEGGSRYVAVELDSYFAMTFSPENDRLIVATGLGLVTVNWRRNRVETLYPAEGQSYGVGDKGYVNYLQCLDISPGGTIASGGYDGQIILVDYHTQELLDVLVDRDERVERVQFSADGRYLFASYEYHSALFDLGTDLAAEEAPQP